MNDTDTIRDSFAPYYRTTILSDETDPNKLHDLKADLDGHQVYSADQLDDFAKRFLSEDAGREALDPILDGCVAEYLRHLDEDGQVDFKGKAKAFLRSYGFLATILPYTNADWEKLSIFLDLLVPKLPAPVEEDLSKGILEAIDMDSYRAEKKAVQHVQLPDEDAEIEATPTDNVRQKPEPEIDRLSSIIEDFNARFGNVEWKDKDKIDRVIAEELPAKVAADKAYQNAAANSDEQNARIELDRALERAVTDMLADHADLFKLFSDNPPSANGSPRPSSPPPTTKPPSGGVETAKNDIGVDSSLLRRLQSVLRYHRQCRGSSIPNWRRYSIANTAWTLRLSCSSPPLMEVEAAAGGHHHPGLLLEVAGIHSAAHFELVYILTPFTRRRPPGRP